jgi:hypothetical protein
MASSFETQYSTMSDADLRAELQRLDQATVSPNTLFGGGLMEQGDVPEAVFDNENRRVVILGFFL